MGPIKNHYLDIPEERKLRIFREEDGDFLSMKFVQVLPNGQAALRVKAGGRLV